MTGIESVFLVVPSESVIIKNSSEALHGAIYNALKKKLDTDKLHNDQNKSIFSVSPLFSSLGRISTNFKKEASYLFRLCTLREDIFRVFRDYYMVKGSITIQGTDFHIVQMESVSINLDNLTPTQEFTMNFISPVTFRSSRPGDIPVPYPEILEKHFKNISELYIKENSDLYPLLTFLKGRTQPIRFKRYLLIGFRGRIKLKFHQPTIIPFLSHFLGTGHNCARGMGNTIVEELDVPQPLRKLRKMVENG